MSNPFSESVRKDVWYPDDLPDLGRIELVSDAPESADEVPYDDAQFGQWVEVENGEGTVWAAAPEQLRSFLGASIEEHETTDLVFEVVDCEKGPADHDPYEVEAKLTHVEGEAL